MKYELRPLKSPDDYCFGKCDWNKYTGQEMTAKLLQDDILRVVIDGHDYGFPLYAFDKIDHKKLPYEVWAVYEQYKRRIA